MEKCWVPECKRKVIVSCACNNNKIFCCKQHLHSHVVGNLGNCNHDIENIFVIIPEEKQKMILESSLESINSIKALKTSMKNHASELIRQINKSCNLMISKLSKLEKQFIEVLNNVIRMKKCNKKFILKYLDLYILDTSETLYKQNQSILHQVRNSFDFKLSTEKYFPKPVYNDIFFCSGNNTKFNSINVDLLKKSTLEFAPVSFQCFQSCRIDKEKFFVNGGQGSDKTYLIDFGKKNYEVLLPCSEMIYRAACVIKDNIAHIFGGLTKCGITSNCKGFDFNQRRWINLPNLPNKSEDNTASILRDAIIISGFHLSVLYEYKNNTFTEILSNLTSIKVVCTGWVITDNGLVYENTVGSKSWITQYCNFKLEIVKLVYQRGQNFNKGFLCEFEMKCEIFNYSLFEITVEY